MTNGYFSEESKKKFTIITGILGAVFFTIFSFAAPPANDNFSARITLTGTSGVVTGTTVEATLETDEPVHAYSYGGNGSNSIWYSWTAPGTAKYTFETIKSDKNSFVCVYTGNSLLNLKKVIYSNVNVTLSATNGTTYQIAIVSRNSNSTGRVILNYYKVTTSPSIWEYKYTKTNHFIHTICAPNGSLVYCNMDSFVKTKYQTNQYGIYIFYENTFYNLPKTGLTVFDKKGNKIIDKVVPQGVGSKYYADAFNGKTLLIFNQDNNHLIAYNIKKNNISLVNEQAVENFLYSMLVGSEIFIFQSIFSEPPNMMRMGLQVYDKKLKKLKWSLPIGDYTFTFQNINKKHFSTVSEKTFTLNIVSYKKGKKISEQNIPIPLNQKPAFCFDGKGGILYWNREDCPVGTGNTSLTYVDKKNNIIFIDKTLSDAGAVWQYAAYAEKYLFTAKPNGFNREINAFKINKKMKNVGTAEIYDLESMVFDGKQLIVYQENSGIKGITVFTGNLKKKWVEPLAPGTISSLGNGVFVRETVTLVSGLTNYTCKIFNKKKTIATHSIDYQ